MQAGQEMLDIGMLRRVTHSIFCANMWDTRSSGTTSLGVESVGKVHLESRQYSPREKIQQQTLLLAHEASLNPQPVTLNSRFPQLLAKC
eukprot:4539539-Amphidinium_carterae.1